MHNPAASISDGRAGMKNVSHDLNEIGDGPMQTVDFPSLSNARKAHPIRSSQFLILGPCNRIAPGAFKFQVVSLLLSRSQPANVSKMSPSAESGDLDILLSNPKYELSPCQDLLSRVQKIYDGTVIVRSSAR
jgi:hypothetical protein